MGLGTGMLVCNHTCTGFITVGCQNGAICGNNRAEESEACDGSDLRNASCETIGFGSGTLLCQNNCSGYDTTGCSCGNGLFDEGETCDDGNTNNGDGCDSSCQIEYGWACTGDPSVCNTICGDNYIVSGEEVCDGTNLNGRTCAYYNYVNLSGLACSSDCDSYNTSGCTASCGNVVEPGEACDDGNTTGGDRMLESLHYRGKLGVHGGAGVDIFLHLPKSQRLPRGGSSASAAPASR
jgi:cysteine-rich repeat protein